MSTFGTDNHFWFDGIAPSSIHSTRLPEQTVSDSVKRKPDFGKKCMDALEAEGVKQLAENVKFRDYYKMVSGHLVHADYGLEDNDIISQVRGLGDKVAIPTFVKHYDIIGILVRKLVGEWEKQRNNFRVNSTADEISENDYLRERTRRANDWYFDKVSKEIDAFLVSQGIDPKTQQNFQSEEEQQAYQQQLEQAREKAVPFETIERELSKNFKTKASEWAEHTLDNDERRFFENKLDSEEMKDRLLTGRFFRHYHIGYDHYKPERWNPLEVFFSQDVDVEYPQDGEYVGRVTRMSVSNIMKRFGHLLKPSQIKQLNGRFSGANNDPKATSYVNKMQEGFFGQTQIVPFRNYYDYDLGLQIQDALDIPMGETIIDTENGQQKIPTWLSTFQSANYMGRNLVGAFRDDINLRTDVLQVTEAYWRSWKRMWFLNYIDSNGIAGSEIVTDDLLPEFIEEHGIKKITTKSLQDLQKEVLADNTMYEFWIPEVWQGIKINGGGVGVGGDIYLQIQPLPYQIKGDSNLYDVKLPVAGIIGTSLAQILRPYQVGYNICLNQIFNLLSKEMGMFFLFDINFLPSEFKDEGNIEQSLEKLQQFAKDVGIVPIDSQKQNIQGAQNMNTFMVQDVSFDKQINSRVQLSNWYFQKALEQIGFTPQRLGGATTYETATGLQQGMEAQYDQTAGLFTEMATAKLKSMELHLAIAQYCQKEYIDKDFVFTGTDNDKIYINLTDPDFPLRRIGLIPSNSPNERRILENVRNYLMTTNTLGSDLLDIAQGMATNTLSELISIGRRERIKKDQEIEKQRQHEQQLIDKQLQAQAQDKQADREFKASESAKDRETKLESERINALGRASDKQSDMKSFEQINQAAREALQDSMKQEELDVKKYLAENKVQLESQKISNISESLRLQAEKLQKDYELKKEALRTSKENSIRNSIDKNLNN